MSEERRTPDAVLAPDSWKGGGDAMNRANRIAARAEEIMGLDYAAGERAVLRLAEGSHHFAARSIHETLYFPASHPRSGQPRYNWVQQDDGSCHGFYVDDEARKTAENPAPPPAALARSEMHAHA